MIDDERGWVIAQVWNRMIDPGDGRIHLPYNITILRCAGNMEWSHEEDVCNPALFATVVKGWIDYKRELDAKKS